MSPSLHAEHLRARGLVLRALRSWFDDHGYLECPTPARVPSPAMEPTLYALRCDGGYLRTSPEFALKRVVASGLPRVYEIGPCFRAEEKSPWHATEFLMLEWYRVGASLGDLMDEVEQLVNAAAAALGREPVRGWTRVSVREAFEAVTGIDIAHASAAEISPDDPDDWDGAFFRRWVMDVEQKLPFPCFVHDWPASQCALARVHPDPEWPVALRFEAFLGGVELANAFDELIDSSEQARRFDKARAEQSGAGDAQHPVDEVFVDAVGRMPPTCGIALGVDRLVAVLLGEDQIHTQRVAHPDLF